MRLVAFANVCHESPRLRRGTFCASRSNRAFCPPAEPGAFSYRRGMTLVELLVVLALLVVIGSIVVPVFTGSFSSVRLRRAGDQIITRWSQARARAIESGEVFQFTYTPDSGTYQVGPWLPVAQDALGTGSSTSATTRSASESAASPTTANASQTASTAASEDPTGQNVALPDKITFKSGEIAVEDALTAERQVASLQSRGADVTTPILFFPDGTTSQASIVIGNDRNQFVRLTLRGLTGVGRATDILSQEELQRTNRR
ncbi:MAG TPA: prepilin-type N-terminal cleavage/methylation domain-containing protein [Lacipirellula sp.]